MCATENGDGTGDAQNAAQSDERTEAQAGSP